MTISCPRAGQIWATDEMVDAMRELKALGVNWIAIHPYAGISPDGTVGGARIDRLYADPVWITRPIAEAHRLGLKIMIKPHIAYWGSSFRWRGEIRFETEEQWQRFFETYERWITMVAELSGGADAFVVGTELDATVHHQQQWRRIIAAVRNRLNVPLTYSANWDRFEEVRFWDALDAIGIQSYFPLVAHDGLPSPQELEESWARIVDRLEEYGRRHDRRIILAELGYNRSSRAAARPWEYGQGGPDAEEVQGRCLTAALGALEGSEIVTGAFLWKWFPGERRWRGNFLMTTREMRQVIGESWGRFD
jgi:sugar phosphate isomerase/epimerase